MAVHFHPLKVSEVKKETDDCVCISFEIPENLRGTFSFMHGQNITIRKNIGGEDLRRSYSICTAPHEGKLSVGIKEVSGGKFSTYANQQLKPGDILEVLPPTGKFNTKLSSNNKKRYMAFAAGSGITPILSIIKTTLHNEPGSSFTLVYGNRSRSSILFFETLEGLKNKYLQRFQFIPVLSREKTDASINHGRINGEKIKELQKMVSFRQTDEFFICGPETMIHNVTDELTSLGIEKGKIHFELFTTPGKTNTKVDQQTKNDSGPKSNITIKLDGRSFDFDLAATSSSILDAALQQGADLPFACKGGVCCTCRARLIEGEVTMDANYSLEPDELAAGFILTCQSHPKTPKVLIDFDVR